MEASLEFFVNGRFQGRTLTGVERYARETVRHFNRPHRVLSSRWAVGGLAGHLWEQLALPGRVGRGVLWSPANTGPLAVADQVLTIHDLGPLDHPEWYRPLFTAWYRWLWPRLVDRIRMVAANSNFTRSRITARFGLAQDRIVVVPVGVDPDHFYPRSRPEIRAIRDRYGLPERYVLFIGTIQPRKNLAGLAEAFLDLKGKFPAVQLVAAGEVGGAFAPSAVDLRGVRFPGRVPDADLPAFYSGAAAFIQPSFYEGAALTLLEAMACGSPVAAARGSALEEYVGDAGLWFEPGNPRAITDVLQALLGEAETRRRLREAGLERARGYSWSRCAAGIEAVLEAIRLPASP